MKTKTILIILILLSLITSSIASAESPIIDHGNLGGGAGGVQGGQFTWSQTQAGYRITIVDENFRPVSRSVDFLFTQPQRMNRNNYFVNSRATSGLVNFNNRGNNYAIFMLENLRQEGTIRDLPPLPVNIVNGVAVGTGEQFREWFLSGSHGISMPTIPASIPPSNRTRRRTNSRPTVTPTVIPTVRDASQLNYILTLTNRAYRHKVQEQSNTILSTQQTDITTAIAIERTIANYRISFILATLRGKPRVEAQLEALQNAYMKSIENSSTNAQANIVFISVIHLQLGRNWVSSAPVRGTITLNIRDNSILMAQNTDKITISAMELDRIPLSSNDSVGNYVSILNHPNNPNLPFTFALPNMEPGRGMIETMVERNYSVIVEPVTWFVPAQWINGAPANPYRGGFVFGTISNLLRWHGSQPRFANGGAYRTPLRVVGWSTLYVGENWPNSSNPIIRAFTGSTAARAISNLNNLINNRVGIGMHIYTTNAAEVTSVQRTDDPTIRDGRRHYAPDPTNLPGDANYKSVRIIKYYENELPDGTIDRQQFVRESNPPNIRINNERFYTVRDWFITTREGLNSQFGTYDEAKRTIGNTRTGTSNGFVELTDEEFELHVLLTRQSTSTVDGGLTLRESEISRFVTTMDTTMSGWGPRTFTFRAASMYGPSHTHCCGTGDDDCSPMFCSIVWGDSAFRYIITNSAQMDTDIEANITGGFTPRMVNNTLSGNIPITGGTNNMESAEYQTVIWRALDIPTIAAYKEPDTNPLRNLLNRRGNTPQGNRHDNGVYTRALNIQLSVSRDSDLTTHTVHSLFNSIFRSVTHTHNTVDGHSGDVTVRVFRGTTKPRGDLTTPGRIATETSFGSASSYNSEGLMRQNTTPIRFHPYIRMTYQVVGSNNRTNVNVLSQQVSEVLGNDFAEAAWFHPERINLLMTSNQWSTHARAVNPDEVRPWAERNTVLPGGAIFNIGDGGVHTRVAAVTWQTIVETPERNNLASALPANEYTITRANNEHASFVSSMEEVLRGLNLVQWVNSNVNADYAWDEDGIKVGPNVNLQPLGISGNTSNEAKHHLQVNGTQANSARLDVIRTTNNPDVFFKVFADTSGNIYLARNIGGIGNLRLVSGDNLNVPGVTVELILDKTVTYSDVHAALNNYDAAQLNHRTLLITNFVRSLERNRGNDTSASWAPDGRWYNEAWDGIYVMRKSTIVDVGFNKPALRSSALDPRLTPPRQGQADMFNRAFLSQFRLHERSTARIAEGRIAGFIGTFRGQDIRLPNMENMYMSKRFFIPNVTVQDLR